MTTYGNMAAKKRAFNSAFTSNNTKPATASSTTTTSSASLYDFDFDDVDTSASTIATRRATMVAPKPMLSSRPAAKTPALETQRPKMVVDDLSKATKSAPQKMRSRQSIIDTITLPRTSPKPTAAGSAPQFRPDTTSRTAAQKIAVRKPQPPLTRATTDPNSMPPPKLTRQAVSDPYDLPMDDAPPLCEPTSIRKQPILPSTKKPENKRHLLLPVSRQTTKPSIHKRSQSSTGLSTSTSNPSKQTVKFASGQIDSFFKKTLASSAPAGSLLEDLPTPRRVFSSESHALAQAASRESPKYVASPTAQTSKYTYSRSLSRGDSMPTLSTKLATAISRPTTPKVPKSPQKKEPSSNPPKRRRIIDALVAQAEPSSDSDDESESDRFMIQASSSTALDTPQRTFARPTIRSGLSMRSRGPKITYASAQRSLRADPAESDPNHDPFALPLIPSLVSPKKEKDSFDFGDGPESDEDALPKGAIRSIHELRMAGANNRFADQMDDLFDRIAQPSLKPNSMRRNALLELASRIKEKSFSRQFRDNSAESRLFAQVGQETDIVSGFAIVAILLTLLSSSSMPHLLPLLQEQKVTFLLQRLLNCQESITELSLKRQTNLSKHGKTIVANLKKDIVKLPIWKGASTARDMSPRTLTLKFMDLYGKPGDLGDYVVSSKSMGDTLFSILHQYADHDWREDATSDEKLDCFLAASILGAHAMGFEHSGLASYWNTHHFPIVISVVDVTLRHTKFGPLEHAALKLALNMSNNNPGAVTATGILVLFKNFASAIHKTFGEVKNSVGKVDLSSEFSPFTKLLLMLGALINFCEHCSPVRHSVEEWTEGGSPVDGLIEIFLQDNMSTYQADSVEKTQLNVGYGYLSILLAYLCLSRPIRRKLESRSGGKGLSDLRDSVREFMIMQSKVDTGRSHSDHIQRIQNLLDQLEMGI